MASIRETIKKEKGNSLVIKVENFKFSQTCFHCLNEREINCI